MLTRRRMLSALVLGSLVGLRPRSGRADAVRVLLVGDSLIYAGFGPVLHTVLEQQHGCVVERHGKVASGLARPDFYDWFEVGPTTHAAFAPDLVVAMFGGNDRQALYMPGRRGPRWIDYESPKWEGEYRRRINAFADLMAPAHERLVWVGMPQMRSRTLRAHVAYVNRLVRTELSVRTNARFVDIWTVLAEDGKFTEHLEIDGQLERVRMNDGVHITRAGGRVLTEFVEPRVVELFSA